MKKILILLLVCSLVLSGCSNAGDSDVTKQFEELEEKNLVLESEIKTITSEKKTIETELAELIIKYEALESENLNLRTNTIASPNSNETTREYSLEYIAELEKIFSDNNLSRFDFVENIFFMDAMFYSPEAFIDFDHTSKMKSQKEAMLVFEIRSKEAGIYDDLLSYGVGVVMDAIIPFSSILMVFGQEDEVDRQSNDLMMEVNFNMEHGRNVGLKQTEFMEKIKAYYTLALNDELEESDIINFRDQYIEYYETELSKLSTIYINQKKVELMSTLFFIKTDNTYDWNEDEEMAKTEEEISRIAESLTRLDNLYRKIKQLNI